MIPAGTSRNGVKPNSKRLAGCTASPDLEDDVSSSAPLRRVDEGKAVGDHAMGFAQTSLSEVHDAWTSATWQRVQRPPITYDIYIYICIYIYIYIYI